MLKLSKIVFLEHLDALRQYSPQRLGEPDEEYIKRINGIIGLLASKQAHRVLKAIATFAKLTGSSDSAGEKLDPISPEEFEEAMRVIEGDGETRATSSSG